MDECGQGMQSAPRERKVEEVVGGETADKGDSNVIYVALRKRLVALIIRRK